MNSRLLAIVGALTAFGVIYVSNWAWHNWVPLGRYRIRRNYAAMQAITQQYLQGSVPLDTAASELGRRMRDDFQQLGWAHRDDATSPGTTATNMKLIIAPNAATDPRVDTLLQHAISMSRRSSHQ